MKIITIIALSLLLMACNPAALDSFNNSTRAFKAICTDNTIAASFQQKEDQALLIATCTKKAM